MLFSHFCVMILVVQGDFSDDLSSKYSKYCTVFLNTAVYRMFQYKLQYGNISTTVLKSVAVIRLLFKGKLIVILCMVGNPHAH